MAAVASGLEGVVAAETELSSVDGERGELIVAGARLEALTGVVGFEALTERLWRRPLNGLGAARVAAFERLPQLGGALRLANGMDALRAAVAQLPASSVAEEVVAAVGVFAAAWARMRAGGQPVSPRAELGHAQDLLRIMTGADPLAERARALEAYLVTVADHGMNASTFTARVIASTGSDLVSAIVGAIGALKGPLHGGAPGPVLDMLDDIGEPSRATDWLEAELAAGRRIMGMGHRIYRVRDPRAAVLEAELAKLEANGISTGRLTLARSVERSAQEVLTVKYPQRSLQANVEFYTAVLLDTVGVPRDAFSVMFAAGRVSGWCAHVDEQRRTGRLIRPDSKYVGPQP